MFSSPLPVEVIPDQTVFDYLFGELRAEDRDRTAIVDGPTGAVTTYGALVDGILGVAGALAADGIGPGDVVALHAPNSAAFAVAFHGILRSGASATTVSALASGPDLAKQLVASRARALFTVEALLATAVEAAEAVGLGFGRIVVLDGADGFRSLADLVGRGLPAPELWLDPATHVAALPYSSGTTAAPKGVMLSHRNLVANVVQCRRAFDIAADDRVLAILPFFHIYGMTVLLNLALARRATLITMPRFELTEFLRTIQDEGCTFAFVAPPVVVALAKSPLVADYDLASLRGLVSGAAPLDTALAETVTRRTGATLRQAYGMSELSPVSHAVPADRADIPCGSIGVPVANVDCRLLDTETGEEIVALAEGDRTRPGELLVRGPNVMLGYLDNPDATAGIMEPDGFLHTGDVAQIDRDGNFWIVDRLKELIKYKGYQVPPAELEALLLTHPAIADAAVIGVPDADGEEIPKAFVVVAEAQLLDARQVMDFVAERVAPYKKVREVEFIERVPKSASGKILRRDLRQPAR
jgi:acyl-CoA synthetase (AMP-forming)/AMP-acid ligase II